MKKKRKIPRRKVVRIPFIESGYCLRTVGLALIQGTLRESPAECIRMLPNFKGCEVVHITITKVFKGQILDRIEPWYWK